MTLDQIPGWMPQENRDKLTELIREYDIRTVVEIGSFLGLSAGWFAQRVEHVTCVDWWQGSPKTGIPMDCYQQFKRNMEALGVADKITTIRGNSNDVADRVRLADLVYIDGDHSFDGCKRDIELYRSNARRVICGDDYAPREYYQVIEAVTATLPDHQHYGEFWWAVIG